MLAPAKIPVAAGKNMANTEKKSWRTLLNAIVRKQVFFNIVTAKAKCIKDTYCVCAELTIIAKKSLGHFFVAFRPNNTANHKLTYLASHSMPTTTITNKINIVILPIMRTSCMPPSIILTPMEFNKSNIDSQKPTTYMAHATAFASENIKPIEPPNSGPNERDIM
ncbi:hypothetical protein EVAR_71820_1 [Eumeta japonica]|uniref:Uncharacterized protein n=1 Tax=Eumeta variegata TaxID=151549 RepID=A0A4C1TK79_EUMVA|nr:hypothetical protein EVAR_71820_1 [Eumeta japonica]